MNCNSKRTLIHINVNKILRGACSSIQRKAGKIVILVCKNNQDAIFAHKKYYIINSRSNITM